MRWDEIKERDLEKSNKISGQTNKRRNLDNYIMDLKAYNIFWITWFRDIQAAPSQQSILERD